MAEETIVTLRSGNGSVPGTDSEITFLEGPQNSGFPSTFDSDDFDDARAGANAFIIVPHGAWKDNLDSDPTANWIATRSTAATDGWTGLYAIDFEIPEGLESATMDFAFLVDNVLGDANNEGVFINGTPLDSTKGGGFGSDTTFSSIDIFSLLNSGTNTLYVNARDTGGPGALEFSATITVIATPPPADDGGPAAVVRPKPKTEMLPDRPTAKTRAIIDSILLTKSLIINKGQIRMPALSMAEGIVNGRLIGGRLSAKIHLSLTEKTYAKLKFQSTDMSKSIIGIDAWIDRQIGSITKVIEASSKLSQLLILKDSQMLTFEFDEVTNNEALIAFTHSSSFVGNVRYNTDTQGMTMILNGKEYDFCDVPARIFDSFQGADSKGAFFARSIKGQFNC